MGWRLLTTRGRAYTTVTCFSNNQIVTKFLYMNLKKSGVLNLFKPLCFGIALTYLFCFSGCASHKTPRIRIFDQIGQSVKPKVAVLKFRQILIKKDNNKKPFVTGVFTNPNAGYFLANIFSQELSESGLFSVLDRSDVIKILKKEGMDETEDINKENYGKFGKALGVDAIITGTVKKFGFLYPTIIPRVVVKFNVEYIDIKTNSIIWTAGIKDKSSSEIDERDLARKHIKKAIKNLKRKLNQ